jgi:prepilin-type N-terminal cleavage/methylation domain-containing protein
MSRHRASVNIINKSYVTSNQGFTLIELIVVMAVFIVVIMITGDSFNRILTQSLKLGRMEESNIEGVVGLEMMRHDLEQAGFALPFAWHEDADDDPGKRPVYKEAQVDPANKLNDAPSNIPRALAFQSYSSTKDVDGAKYGGISGSWYLGVKAATLSRAAGGQKWTYANYSTATYGSKPPKVWSSGNFESGDRVVVLRRTFLSGSYTNRLAYNPGATSTYWTVYSNSGFVPDFAPRNVNEIVYAYGLGQKNDDIGMPFNRADFFIGRPEDSSKLPASCAPNAGILYKATINQKDGKLNYMPLLDCVADMQVVMGWDLWDKNNKSDGQDGEIDIWSSPALDLNDPATVKITKSVDEISVADARSKVVEALKDPANLRTSLKMVKVYLLAQIGRRDSAYRSPDKFIVAGTGELALGREYTLTDEMRNYRWKVYRIVARPKNLQLSQ